MPNGLTTKSKYILRPLGAVVAPLYLPLASVNYQNVLIAVTLYHNVCARELLFRDSLLGPLTNGRTINKQYVTKGVLLSQLSRLTCSVE